MMEFLDFLLHAEKYLKVFLETYGYWIYMLLFVIVFCETGLVVTPFLPGDSLLFTAGALAAQGFVDVHILFWILFAAAVLGDTVNYWIGWWLGPKVFHYQNNRWLNKEYLERAHAFYEKYGGKAIILARFVPIVRTFAPFVAGIGTMNYPKFILFNIVGGLAWVLLFLFGGYFLGNLPQVKNNLTLLVIIIIVVSVLPIVYEWVKARRKKQAAI